MELRFTTAGESHGPGLVAIVEGLPAGLELDREALDRDMARRQLGHGRGGRMKIESDAVEIRSGVRHGRTLGSPVAVLVANRDYPNWDERMNPWPVDAEVEESHLPRPGHADLAGLHKFGFTDVRNVLERASARETAARVAAGALAKEFLRALGVEIRQPCDPDRLGQRAAARGLAPEDFDGVDDSPVRCLDDEDGARRWSPRSTGCGRRTSRLGGKFEVRAFGLVPGLGSHVSWDEKLDGRLAQAVCSIQSIKGVSLGEAWDVAGRPGSEAHDEIFYSEERGWYRETNRAGGLEGGMTNGEPLIVQAAIKPISTMTQPLRSVDTETKQPARGDARADRLDRGPRRGGRRRGDGGAGARGGLPGEVRRRPHRRRARRDHRLRGADRMAALGADAPRPAIVLIGFMAAGKSAAAGAIAERLGLDAADADELIERELGEPIAAFFEREGEGEFRRREQDLVLSLLEPGWRAAGARARRRRGRERGRQGGPRRAPARLVPHRRGHLLGAGLARRRPPPRRRPGRVLAAFRGA